MRHISEILPKVIKEIENKLPQKPERKQPERIEIDTTGKTR